MLVINEVRIHMLLRWERGLGPSYQHRLRNHTGGHEPDKPPTQRLRIIGHQILPCLIQYDQAQRRINTRKVHKCALAKFSSDAKLLTSNS
jgi:hypothetical protein